MCVVVHVLTDSLGFVASSVCSQPVISYAVGFIAIGDAHIWPTAILRGPADVGNGGSCAVIFSFLVFCMMKLRSQEGDCFGSIRSMSPYVLNGFCFMPLRVAMSLLIGSDSSSRVLCGIRVSTRFVCGVPFLHKYSCLLAPYSVSSVVQQGLFELVGSVIIVFIW